MLLHAKTIRSWEPLCRRLYWLGLAGRDIIPHKQLIPDLDTGLSHVKLLDTIQHNDFVVSSDT
jgi:hypothetical protein